MTAYGNVRDMFNPPRYKCSDVDSYGCISNRPPTHSPSMRDILCLFQTSSFLLTFLATSLPGHSPTCDVCTTALPNPIALNCDPLSLSLSFPLERVFLKFLSHYSKRMVVKFAIKNQEPWVGLPRNNLRNIQ